MGTKPLQSHYKAITTPLESEISHYKAITKPLESEISHYNAIRTRNSWISGAPHAERKLPRVLT